MKIIIRKEIIVKSVIACYRYLGKLMSGFSVVLFGFLVLLNIPYIVYMFNFDSKLHAIAAFERSFFASAFFCMVLAFLNNKCIIRLLKIILLAISLVIFIFDSFALYQYGHLLNIGMLDILISTNYNEASEYISQFVSIQYLIGLVGSLFFIVCLIWLLYKLNRRYCNTKLLAAIIAGLIVINVIDAFRMGCETWVGHTSRAFLITRVGNIAWATYKNVREYEEYEKISSNAVTTIVRDESDIPYVVFILGESTNKNHMSIYGYELETTPKLKKRQKMGELFVFSDVISHRAHTLPAMRELFSFYRRDSEEDWFHYNNIFDILRETEYKTVWLSNQESSGVWNLDKYYSKKCDMRNFTDLRDSHEDYDLRDEALLPLIDNIRYDVRNFVVIHLIGTHAEYNKRYPSDFSKFQGIDEAKGVNEEQKKIRSEYDNAILYNDYVVDAIIEKFADKDAIVIYVSDHADEVYEDRDFLGHEEDMLTKHMLEIPMLIWTSRVFRETRPDVINNLEKIVDRPFMTDDMIHVLLDLMKIETPEFDPHKSVINNGFEATKRTINGRVYEKIGNETMLK